MTTYWTNIPAGNVVHPNVWYRFAVAVPSATTTEAEVQNSLKSKGWSGVNMSTLPLSTAIAAGEASADTVHVFDALPVMKTLPIWLVYAKWAGIDGAVISQPLDLVYGPLEVASPTPISGVSPDLPYWSTATTTLPLANNGGGTTVPVVPAATTTNTWTIVAVAAAVAGGAWWWLRRGRRPATA